MMKKEIVFTEKAPNAVGPYSQAIVIGDMIYLSGQVAFVPETGELISNNIEQATKQTIENIKAILQSKDIGLEKVIKTTVLLKNIDDYDGMNQVYSGYFSKNPPARTAFAVADLPKNALVEIEVIAHI